LASLSATLGALYMATFVIEFFGVVSAVTQRLMMVRIFAFASVLAATFAIAAGFLRTIVHFTLKEDLINECTTIANNATVTYTNGLWGPTTTDVLTLQEAQEWCNDAWSHDSFSEIVSLIIIIILGILFSALAFSYYRQLLDPTANAFRAPSNQVRMGDYPSRYNAPYDSTVPTLGYNYPRRYTAAPVGEERDEAFVPPYESDGAKLPGYGVGVGGARGLEDKSDDKADPFSDFDGLGEQDVTSTRHV
jgi:hypothetical protein